MTAPPLDALYPAHLAEISRRAEHALAATGHGALVLAAGEPPLQFRDDQPYPFVASPEFRRWAPLPAAPGSCVVHRPGERPRLLFLQPQDYWHQPPQLPDAAWLAAFEVSVLRSPAQLAALLPAGAAYVGPADGAPDGLAVNPPGLMARLDYGRAVKTAYEIACLREASRRAVAGHRAALEAWRAGATEFEIHLAYLRACCHEEFELPYASIIATNEAAAVLHYTVRRRKPALPRRSLLIDAGAQYRGYAADITRTYAATPCVFADLVQALEPVQLALCALVTAGRPYADIQFAAHRGVADVLRMAGLIGGSTDAAVETGLTSVFFPHGIGHLLGQQVHDLGGLQADETGTPLERPPGHPFLRLVRTIEPGYVVTIEPGIYFIPMLLDAARQGPQAGDIRWEAVERLAPFGGVRIEDNVVAHAAGPENLTRQAFTAAA